MEPAQAHPNQPDSEIQPISVTVKRAAQLTGLGPTKLYELLAAGAIESFKVGNRRLIKYESLRKLASPSQVA